MSDDDEELIVPRRENINLTIPVKQDAREAIAFAQRHKGAFDQAQREAVERRLRGEGDGRTPVDELREIVNYVGLRAVAAQRAALRAPWPALIVEAFVWSEARARVLEIARLLDE